MEWDHAETHKENEWRWIALSGEKNMDEEVLYQDVQASATKSDCTKRRK